MKKKLILVASFGGHFVQSQRIFPVLQDYEITVISTKKGARYYEGIEVKDEIQDCNFKEPKKAISCFLQSLKLINKVRPDVVISTGAAPGCIFCIISKVKGAKIIWIDSIANTKDLSLSGRIITKFTKNVFSQWEGVALKRKVQYLGKLI